MFKREQEPAFDPHFDDELPDPEDFEYTDDGVDDGTEHDVADDDGTPGPIGDKSRQGDD